MIPSIMRKEMDRLMPKATAEARRLEAEKESAAITSFTSAIAAFGAFFIPRSFGTSIALTGGPQAALFCFLAFYVACLVIAGRSTPAGARSSMTSSGCAARLWPPRPNELKDGTDVALSRSADLLPS